ncbi:MAG: VapE domain-containing protein [Bdellovibrionota bacterium]|mgnify:CR=1 FL=1
MIEIEIKTEATRKAYKLSTLAGLVKTEIADLEKWQDIAAIITQSRWSQSIFRDSYRAAKNFLKADFIALDLDDGFPMDDAAAHFDALNLNYIIGTTKSHQKEKRTGSGSFKPPCDRYRIIFPLEYAITAAEDFTQTWFKLTKDFPYSDKACKDASRYYEPCVEIYKLKDDGLFLEPTKYSPVGPAQKKLGTVVTKVVSEPATEKALQNFNLKGNLSIATLNFLHNGAEPGTWDNMLFKAAKDFQQQGYDVDEAIEKFSGMDNQYYSGKLTSRDFKTIESAYSKVAKYPPRIQFPQQKEEGKPLTKHPDNMAYLCTNILGFEVKFNLMKSRVFCNGKPIDDFTLAEVRTAARAMNLSDSKDFAVDTLKTLAMANSFHPFKDFVESKVYDGADHLGQLFETFKIQSEYQDKLEHFKKIFKRFFIGLIAKVYKPGSQNLVLVFKGEQGTQKSRWVARLNLVDGMFAEGALNPDSSDDRARHRSYVLHHFSELDAVTGRRDVAALKSFLTLEDVSVRLPYDIYPIDSKSRLSFIASVNSDAFMRDPTGNRRFLTIPIEKMNAAHTVNLQQVFAQALYLFNSGEKFWFEKEEVEIINEINDDYSIPTLAKEVLAKLEKTKEEIWLTAHEIANQSLNGQQYRVDIPELRRLLKDAGFEKEVKKKNGQKLTYYKVKIVAENNGGGT